jgi:hypothetical protein
LAGKRAQAEFYLDREHHIGEQAPRAGDEDAGRTATLASNGEGLLELCLEH